MPRFVVLQHESPRGRHWDFMLEVGEGLRTWALAAAPDEPQTSPAQPLPDHRLAYLDYEGPISGNRGHVTRWDQGTYVEQSASETAWVLRLSGQRLRGMATLERGADPAGPWEFRFVQS